MPKATKKRTAAKTDKYQVIADKLLELMQAGTVPWRKPWSTIPYVNASSGHRYSGVNPLLLEFDILLRGYSSPLFVGFQQAADRGWTIRKGSKATALAVCKTSIKEEEDPDTGEIEETFRIYRTWKNVFNLDCVDDRDADLKVEDIIAKYSGEPNPGARIDDAEQLIDAQKAEIIFGGNRACYVPNWDRIHLPKYSSFSSAEAYYATAIHELIHRTGHASRLSRDLSGAKGTPKYAFEELVADMGAAFVCGTLGIQPDLEHHASYLDHWMSLIQDDNQAFFKAFKLAKAAADLLLENAGLLLPAEEDNAEAA